MQGLYNRGFFFRPADDFSVEGACVLRGEISPRRFPAYLRLLGLRGTLLTGLDIVRHLLLDLLSQAVNLDSVYSVRGALRKWGVRELDFDSVNDDEFLEYLRHQGVDAVVSIACPEVVTKEALKVPPQGWLNLHCAPLPRYRRLLSSFWVLAKEEDYTAVTVHRMNKSLDDGPILAQENVPIECEYTMHDLHYKDEGRACSGGHGRGLRSP